LAEFDSKQPTCCRSHIRDGGATPHDTQANVSTSGFFFLFHLKYMFFKFVCNNFYLFFGPYIGIFYFSV